MNDFRAEYTECSDKIKPTTIRNKHAGKEKKYVLTFNLRSLPKKLSWVLLKKPEPLCINEKF